MGHWETYLIKANQKNTHKNYGCLTKGCGNQAGYGDLHCLQCCNRHNDFMKERQQTPIRHLGKRK